LVLGGDAAAAAAAAAALDPAAALSDDDLSSRATVFGEALPRSRSNISPDSACMNGLNKSTHC
jgi:hypothetical protein